MHRRPLLLALALLPLAAAPVFAAELGRPNLNDPEFTKRFTANYGFLSAREPQITEVEIALLEKLAPMIASQPEQARAMLEGMLADGKPVSAAFNHILGTIHATNEQWADAEAQYREAIRKFPDFQRAWNSLGALLMQRSDYPGAAEALSRSVELGASDALSYGMLGYALLRERNYVAAEIAYDQALARGAGNVRWLEGKARLLAEAGRHEETIAATDELLRRDATNLEYWRLQANAHLALGDEKSAARNLEIARQLGPLDPSALYLLGNLYLKQGLPEQALEALLAAIKQLPTVDAATILRVAQSLIVQDQFDLAHRLLATLPADQGKWTTTDLVRHGLLQGRLAVHDQQPDAAIAAFTRVLEIDPLNAEGLYRLATVESEQGRPEKARYHLERIKGDPNYEYGAQLFLAKMLVQAERYEDALTHLRAALRIKPSTEIENLYSRVRTAAQSAL